MLLTLDSVFAVEHKATLHDMYTQLLSKKVEDDVANFMIARSDESTFYNLQRILFNRETSLTKEEKDSILAHIRNKLHELGWKTKLSYGDSVLFVYSTAEAPPNCW